MRILPKNSYYPGAGCRRLASDVGGEERCSWCLDNTFSTVGILHLNFVMSCFYCTNSQNKIVMGKRKKANDVINVWRIKNVKKAKIVLSLMTRRWQHSFSFCSCTAILQVPSATLYQLTELSPWPTCFALMYSVVLCWAKESQPGCVRLPLVPLLD